MVYSQLQFHMSRDYLQGKHIELYNGHQFKNAQNSLNRNLNYRWLSQFANYWQLEVCQKQEWTSFNSYLASLWLLPSNDIENKHAGGGGGEVNLLKQLYCTMWRIKIIPSKTSADTDTYYSIIAMWILWNITIKRSPKCGGGTPRETKNHKQEKMSLFSW